jgi:hypothetical protein
MTDEMFGKLDFLLGWLPAAWCADSRRIRPLL